ncbi:MAG: TetR/AcrR family transcriptional regulator [Actinomycetota bacterium]
MVNRGPAAAAGNRAALLASARHLFAERGYQVPLSSIARDAGVGQGSLYRHFPTRLDLALAIFEENFAELEALAEADCGDDCLLRLWRRLVEFTLESRAFVETAVEARRQLAGYEGAERLASLLAEPLARAQAAGLVDAAWTVPDLVLAQRMVYGVILTEVDPMAARAAALRAIRLIDPDLAWED